MVQISSDRIGFQKAGPGLAAFNIPDLLKLARAFWFTA